MLRNYVKQQWRNELAGIRIYPQPDETFRLAASDPPVYGVLTCELGACVSTVKRAQNRGSNLHFLRICFDSCQGRVALAKFFETFDIASDLLPSSRIDAHRNQRIHLVDLPELLVGWPCNRNRRCGSYLDKRDRRRSQPDFFFNNCDHAPFERKLSLRRKDESRNKVVSETVDNRRRCGHHCLLSDSIRHHLIVGALT
jgi:hypothetical protein